MRPEIYTIRRPYGDLPVEIMCADDTPEGVKLRLALAPLVGDLTNADLRGIDTRGVPKIANIHQAVYAAASKPGSLDMGSWHCCETTHCRAGWVIWLAGAEGRELESWYGPSKAAALIYMASDPTLEGIPDFYCSNARALADMKRLAEAEAVKP